MKNKSILIHVKNEEALNNYMRMLRNKQYDDIKPYSKEVRAMIEEFMENQWDVYLATISDFDIEKGIYKNFYFINKDENRNMSIEEVNDKISVMIIRNIGSVELNFRQIQEYLNYLIQNYKGKILNNPKAMLKGMTKHYLIQIDPTELLKYNLLTIPTEIFSKEVTFEEICKRYPNNRERYLIKPVTGELSNSLKCLAEIDEEFLRYKEQKVGGWIIQEIQEDVWNGEYQLSFLNGELIYAQKKVYPKDDNRVPNQKNRVISKYYPEEKEIDNMKKVIEYFSKLYNIKIDLCRIDFMKNNDGIPKLLEFEMVNPGFFIGYMEEHDIAIKNITRSIRIYCEKYVES